MLLLYCLVLIIKKQPSFNHQKTDKFLMHRDSLNPRMSDILFKAWICGGYDLFKNI